jgi:hypothetical protein
MSACRWTAPCVGCAGGRALRCRPVRPSKGPRRPGRRCGRPAGANGGMRNAGSRVRRPSVARLRPLRRPACWTACMPCGRGSTWGRSYGNTAPMMPPPFVPESVRPPSRPSPRRRPSRKGGPRKGTSGPRRRRRACSNSGRRPTWPRCLPRCPRPVTKAGSRTVKGIRNGGWATNCTC